MSYSIKVYIHQVTPGKGSYYHVAEKTIWKFADGGTWTEVNGCHVLKMSGSGTSGSLRIVSDAGESFIVTLGIHSGNQWGDIVTNLKSDQTACVVNPEYYGKEIPARGLQRGKQLVSYSVSDSKGRTYSFQYDTDSKRNDLTVRVTIA